MDTEVFYLVERNRLVFRSHCVRRCVVLGVGAERANVDLSGRDRAVGVNLGKCHLRVGSYVSNEHLPRRRRKGLGISDSIVVY